MVKRERRCETCAHFYFFQPAPHTYVQGVPEPVAPVIECRRFPPTGVEFRYGWQSGFPAVREDDWCGEWKGKDK